MHWSQLELPTRPLMVIISQNLEIAKESDVLALMLGFPHDLENVLDC